MVCFRRFVGVRVYVCVYIRPVCLDLIFVLLLVLHCADFLTHSAEGEARDYIIVDLNPLPVCCSFGGECCSTDFLALDLHCVC